MMNLRQRRRFPRYLFQGTGVLTSGSGSAPEQVKVLSLSIDGCRILGLNLPMRGAQCRLTLQDQGNEFTAECEITWHGNGVAGIKFITPDDKNMEALKQICKGLRLEPLQPPSPPDAPRHD